MKNFLVCAVLLGAVSLLGQQPAPAPKLTYIETVALQSVSAKLRENQQELGQLRQSLQQVEGEIAKDHPGYRFDEASGDLVKMPEPAKAEAKPDAKGPAKP